MRILLFLIFSLSISANYAQNPSLEESDPKAIELIENIKASFESFDSHKFDFSLNMEFPGHEGEIQEGFIIQQGEKFVIDVKEQKIISDNESVWLYLKNRNEVQINDAEFDETALMKPSDLFTLYESGSFVFAMNHSGKEDGQRINQIECKPLDKDSEYSKLRITLLDATNDIKRIKIFFKDGARMTMSIEEHTKGFETDEGTFVFDASLYEDVVIEDLRF